MWPAKCRGCFRGTKTFRTSSPSWEWKNYPRLTRSLCIEPEKSRNSSPSLSSWPSSSPEQKGSMCRLRKPSGPSKKSWTASTTAKRKMNFICEVRCSTEVLMSVAKKERHTLNIMAKKLKLKIITPEKLILEEMAEGVSLPTTEGEITILPDHIPLIRSEEHTSELQSPDH